MAGTPEQDDKVVSALNSIRDNIWLGDWKDVRSIAENILSTTSNSTYMKASENGQRFVNDLRKKAKTEAPKHPKSWLAENAQDYFRLERLSFESYLLGTMLSRIKTISDSLSDFEEDANIVRQDNYKFRIFRLPTRYEVRSILYKKSHKLDEDAIISLGRQLQSENHTFSTNSISMVFQFFTTREFIEGLILPNTARLSIATSETSEERLKTIADKIFSTFTNEIIEHQR